MTTQSIAGQGSKRGKVSRPLAGLAYWRECGDEFRSLGAGRYEVPSRSVKGRRFEVDIERERCACKDHKLRGVACAHIFAVTIAASKPEPIPSRERERHMFTPEQVMANVARLEAMGV